MDFKRIIRDLLVPTGGDMIAPAALGREGRLPELTAAGWLNSEPLAREKLQGKVTLIDFWTYSCINCLRTIPHLRAWHDAYGPYGLVIIGIHSPEFDFEKDPHNVEAAIRRLKIEYPVALDPDMALWQAFANRYWPAHYFVDAEGQIRYRHFGEGNYAHSESVIRTLLQAAGRAVPEKTVEPLTEPPIDFTKIRTPETYLGWNRLEALGSPESVRLRAVQKYSVAKEPALNIFYLRGAWTIEDEHADTAEPNAAIVFRFSASRANLVLATDAPSGAELLLDGKPLPANAAGADVNIQPDGRSVLPLSGCRMYELADLHGEYGEHLLEIRFAAAGIRAYAFTFG